MLVGVHPQFGVKLDSISFPEICTESSKCHIVFCNFGSDLIINVQCSGESASQVREFINNFQFLSIHSDGCFIVRFSGCRLVYTLSLVSSLILFRFQKFARSLPNATLSFAILAVTSSSMCNALERVLRRYVNLSKTFSSCPFTVTVGSLYGFPVLVGVQPLSFLC